MLSPADLAKRLKIWIDQGLRALDRPPCGIGKTVGSVCIERNLHALKYRFDKL